MMNIFKNWTIFVDGIKHGGLLLFSIIPPTHSNVK